MLQKVIRALSKYRRATSLPKPEFEAPLDGNAFFRQELALSLGPEAAGEVLAEIDYSNRVARMERLAELRRRELAVRKDLKSLC